MKQQLTTATASPFSVNEIAAIRAQFPILNQKINGYPLVYLDNAASSQKPTAVIQSIVEYYERSHANVHRGVHHLSQKATTLYEESRKEIASFLGAAKPEEVIFTSGTTDSINLVAQSWGRKFIHAGDEIILSHMDHHSNIVPWQMLAEEKGAVIKVIDVTEAGELDLDSFETLLNSKTKLVAVNHVSNSLGTVNPIAKIIELAHANGTIVMVDGAQAAPHTEIDVLQMDCDFYAISSHKMYGPTGMGVLYGKEDLLNASPPWRGGGEMIETVSFKGTTFNTLPYKFEAGTPHVAGAIGMAAACKWMKQTGIGKIEAHEQFLLQYATEALQNISRLKIYGRSAHKAAVISFLIEGIHPYDLGALMDKMGVAVRTGHHCTEPLMDLFGIPGTVRASFAVYNTVEEVDRLVAAIQKSSSMLL